MSAVRCPRRYCGLLMEPVTDGNGRVAFVCAGCERNWRKLCRDCPAGVTHHNQLRCSSCATARAEAVRRKWDEDRYDLRRAQDRAYHRGYNARPEVKARRAEYQRQYRASQPRNDADRAYERLMYRTRKAA